MKVLIMALLVISIALPVNSFALELREIPTLERQIADAINDYRKSQGLNELSYDDNIADVARTHSQDMIDRDYFAHETLGTTKQAWLRGSNAGYGMCGDPDALDRYYTTVQGIEEHKKRIAQFEKEAETVRLFWNNDQLQVNAIESKYQKLLKIEQEVNAQTILTYDDINQGKIGIGFAENLMELRGDPITNLDIIDSTIQGWIDSPEHKLGLEDYANSLGVGVSMNTDRILITLNVC